MAEIDLLGLLRGPVRRSHRTELDETASPCTASTLGVVTDIDDAKDLGRVRSSSPGSRTRSSPPGPASPRRGRASGAAATSCRRSTTKCSSRSATAHLVSLRPRLPLEREGPAARARPEGQAARAAEQARQPARLRRHGGQGVRDRQERGRPRDHGRRRLEARAHRRQGGGAQDRHQHLGEWRDRDHRHEGQREAERPGRERHDRGHRGQRQVERPASTQGPSHRPSTRRA